MVKRNDAFTIRTTPAETEQVMRELRGSGHYLSRDLWRGGVSFEVEWIDLLGDPAALARYDQAAELCRDLSLAVRQFGAMNAQVKTAGLDRAMIQGYLKQVLFDLRLDTVLARADAALAEGRQVVISVHSVAGDEEPVEALGADAQEHPVTRRLESAINRINVREIKKEERDGETIFIDLGEIPEALLAREELRERARALPRLRDPVRVIEQHFGASAVAAITGRIPARLRTQRMGEFQAGARRVALISRAGKVGISLHDTNERRRSMLVADYEWSADLFKQELGRVDRTGQRSPPEIVLMASTAAGERKFAATIAARMASLGATCKGSAESTGTDALDQFDMAGGIALEAMKNAVARMGDGARAYFTGSQFLERQRTVTGADVFTPKHRPDEGTQMRHFLLEMLMFPVEEANRTLALWEEEREKLMTDETMDALAARRTGRVRGVVLRERPLPADPPVVLVDVENDDGEARVIARGFVTEHMVKIQTARGPDSNGSPRTRRYLQFTARDGRLVSGLDLSPSEAHRIRWAFGQREQRENTPEAVLQDLRVGEKVDVEAPPGARWTLHLRRDGRIEIRGAKISRDRAALLRPTLRAAVAYEAAGNFLHLTGPDQLGIFLEHFPVLQEPEALAAAA
ncbi:MAG TPA: strawberry notch C-terminal domain-containing protein, partial [Longimicrobium sp.]